MKIFKKIFKKEELFGTLKIIGLINKIEGYQKIYNHSEENMNQEFRF